MYGCGIGPVQHKYNRRLVSKVLNSYVDIITLREDLSLEELELFGVTTPEIILSSDPALSLDAADSETVDREMASAGLAPRENYVCFALRNWTGFSKRIDILAQAAEQVFEKYGLAPVFLSINQQTDSDPAALVAQQLKIPFHIIHKPMEPALAIGVISRMKLMVSMRLHGLIFAAGQGVPIVGISYDPKVAAFLKYIDQDFCIDFDSLDTNELLSLIHLSLEKAGSAEDTGHVVQGLREIQHKNIEAAKRLLEAP